MSGVIGQLFGNYRAVRKLGEGGMGVVYEAVHEEIGKRAAVKVLQATYSRDPQISARFLTEARAVNLVHHPGLVNIFEFGRTADGACYLVMELLEGETLRARIEALGTIPARDARRIVRQVAGALGAAHDKGVIHRDLKPDERAPGSMCAAIDPQRREVLANQRPEDGTKLARRPGGLHIALGQPQAAW